FAEPACVIVKHANPCGAAIGASAREAYDRAFATDPTSAFGGVVAFNRALELPTAEAVCKPFVEVVIAPEIAAGARKVFAAKPNVRVLQVDLARASQAFDFKRVGCGLLVQTPDDRALKASELRAVTRAKPSPDQVNDFLFAW